MNRQKLNDLIEEFEARHTSTGQKTHLKTLAWITFFLIAVLAFVRAYAWLSAVMIP